MLSIWIHLRAFFSVVVVSCIQPINWEQCVRVDQWLIPELKQGINIYFDNEKTFLYKSEREYLNK